MWVYTNMLAPGHHQSKVSAWGWASVMWVKRAGWMGVWGWGQAAQRAGVGASQGWESRTGLGPVLGTWPTGREGRR